MQGFLTYRTERGNRLEVVGNQFRAEAQWWFDRLCHQDSRLHPAAQLNLPSARFLPSACSAPTHDSIPLATSPLSRDHRHNHHLPLSSLKPAKSCIWCSGWLLAVLVFSPLPWLQVSACVPRCCVDFLLLLVLRLVFCVPSASLSSRN